jgi:hypothetical protein
MCFQFEREKNSQISDSQISAMERLQSQVEAHKADIEAAEDAARALIIDYESLDMGRVKVRCPESPCMR